MITYLPYLDYFETAKCLDSTRLGRQRLDVVTILDNLFELNYELGDHPVLKMWRGYEAQLCAYGFVICDEWVSRGNRDKYGEKINWHLGNATVDENFPMERPPWMRDERGLLVALSHQSFLMKNKPEYYSRFFKNTPTNLPLHWPDASKSNDEKFFGS